MEFIREDCIYARQSVDRKDSISIESQIDFCKYELKGVMLSRLVDTFFSRTSWTMLLYAENHSISVA